MSESGFQQVHWVIIPATLPEENNVNMQLIEALRQLHLKPGESYTVEVDGKTVDIRERAASQPEAYLVQEMMSPWFDSPLPEARKIKLRLGSPLPLDPVVMPEDYEGGE